MTRTRRPRTLAATAAATVLVSVLHIGTAHAVQTSMSGNPEGFRLGVSTTMSGNPEGVSTTMGGNPEGLRLGVSTSMSGNPEG